MSDKRTTTLKTGITGSTEKQVTRQMSLSENPSESDDFETTRKRHNF